MSTAAGNHSALGCRTVVVSHLPIGALDSVVDLGDRVQVAGWAIDPDTGAALTVHVYVDGVPTVITANAARADLAPIFPAYGAAHGIVASVAVTPGAHTVCAYALDDAGGPNPLLGCRTV